MPFPRLRRLKKNLHDGLGELEKDTAADSWPSRSTFPAGLVMHHGIASHDSLPPLVLESSKSEREDGRGEGKGRMECGEMEPRHRVCIFIDL